MTKTALNKPSRKLSLDRETLAPLQDKLYAQVTAVFLASAAAGAVVSHLVCH